MGALQPLLLTASSPVSQLGFACEVSHMHKTLEIHLPTARLTAYTLWRTFHCGAWGC